MGLDDDYLDSIEGSVAPVPSSQLPMRERLDMMAVEHRNDVTDGLYRLSIHGSSSSALGVSGSGVTAQLVAPEQSDWQAWRLSHDDYGYVILTNESNGLVLSVAAQGEGLAGTAAQLAAPRDSYEQKWVAVKNADESIKLVSALDDTIALGVNDKAAPIGFDVRLCNVDSATGTWSWDFISTLRSSDTIDALAQHHRNDLPDGSYYVHSCLSDALALDVAGGSTADGANVQAYAFNGTPAQIWEVTHDQFGFVTLINQKTRKALEVADASTAPGANIQQGLQGSSRSQRWIAVRQNDGSFVLHSALSPDRVVDVAGGQAVSRTNVQLWGSNGSAAQAWRFESVEDTRATMDSLANENRDAVQDGTYYLWASVGSRKVLDVTGGSTANGANVQSYTANSVSAQQWIVSHDSNGYITFTNVGSGKVLSVSNACMLPGSNIEQQQLGSVAAYAQKWIAVPIVGTSKVKICSALYPNLVLDVAEASGSDGANVQLYSYNGSAAQHFELLTVNPYVAPCEDILPEGWYRIVPSGNQELAFDVASGSKTNGSNVRLYQANGTLAQLFRFDYRDGYYFVVGAGSGKVLDAAGGCVVPPTNVQIWEENSQTRNQQFSVVANADGTYSFTNRATGLLLTVGGTVCSGANVQLEQVTESQCQRFSLVQQVDLLPEGIYSFQPVDGSHRYLDVVNGSRAGGAQIQAYDRNDTLAQKWFVSLVSDGSNTYTVESLNSGLLLTALSDDTVVQQAADSSSSQYWKLSIGNYGSLIFTNVETGGLLSIEDGSVSSGACVVCTKVLPIDDANMFYPVSTVPLNNGTYFVQSVVSNNFVFDVANGSRSNGANVQLYANNDSGAQKWYATRNVDGSYSFQNARSRKLLDVKNAIAASRVNVQQWESNGSSAQRWCITYEGKGAFRIATALNQQYVLDGSSNSPHNGQTSKSRPGRIPLRNASRSSLLPTRRITSSTFHAVI